MTDFKEVISVPERIEGEEGIKLRSQKKVANESQVQFLEKQPMDWTSEKNM